MPKFNALTTALTVAILSLAALPEALHAQSNEGAELTAEGLSMGAPKDDKPKAGETYIKETIGDWSLRCIVLDENDDPCQMYQLLKDETGQPVVEFTLFRLPEAAQAAAGATVVVPLETSLQQQLSITVDENTGKRYPYSFCNQVGCYARIGLTQEDVDSYKSGGVAVVSLVPALAPDQRAINLNMSLNGFTAAFEQASIIDQ